MTTTTDRFIGAAIGGLFALFLVLGFLTAIGNGVGWDEAFEQNTLAVNLIAIRSLFSGDLAGYLALAEFQDKYYGITFHLAAVPLQALLAPLAERFLGLQPIAAFLLPKHLAVFALYIVSGAYFHRLLRQFLDDRRVCLLLTLVYLLCPYFLGHGTMNIKDLPFMALWLICVERALAIGSALMSGRESGWRPFVNLGLLTGLLLSIRLPGLLVFLFYGILLIAVFVRRRSDFKQLWPMLWPRALIAGTISLIVTWAAYPIFWLEPWRIVDAFSYMAAHPWRTCTLTAGDCVPSLDLPASYIPIWLSVKLPLMALLGLALLPLSLRLVPGSDFKRPLLGAILLSHFLILLVLIATGANLYSELRQVLFVTAILLLVGLVSFHFFSPRAATLFAIATLVLFVSDNVRLFPYQYTWYNELARLGEIDNRYDTDYWGLSARAAAEIVDDQIAAGVAFSCVLARPAHLYRFYLPEDRIPCLIDAAEKARAPALPFLVAATSKYGFTDFPGCRQVGEVARNLALTGTKMTMARVFHCP